MYLITLWKFETEILNLIGLLRVMVEVYILDVLHLIIVNITYMKIALLTTRHLFLEVLSNGYIFSHLICLTILSNAMLPYMVMI